MKRERENPCGVCGHYHRYEAGEVCGVCGHRMPVAAGEGAPPPAALHVSAFPSEVLPDFLYLGSYDNASRSELLKAQGISHILNTVPACQNLYKNSFTYHCLKDDKILQFEDANQFLEQCERERARVLVHCMSGRNRSPAIVIAYLMKSKGWRLAQSYQWVKEQRPAVELSQAVYEQLQEYEKKIFEQVISPAQTFSFGFPKVNDSVAVPTFDSTGGTSIFSRPLDIAPSGFQFGAGHPQNSLSASSFGASIPHPNGGDISMDS